MTEDRFRLFRLCSCPECDGRGYQPFVVPRTRCQECRGEGRIRQEIATARTPEAVGVAIVTLAREGEFEECPFGLLDSTPECETCHGARYLERSWIEYASDEPCPDCKATGVKPTGTWLIRPWLPSARNVTDAARTLAKSKKKSDPQ